MRSNRVCNITGIKYPLFQGGMVWVSDWNLASACSNAGILGTIGTGGMTLSEVETNISKMFDLTCNPFAVNIPLIRPNAEEIGHIAIEMGVKVIITAAGNPGAIIPKLKQSDVTIIHVVPSVRGALKAEHEGADIVVCEGYEAGGHNSPHEITTIALVPQVVDSVDIPVVAAGGIADGRGIAAVMALGAEGVQMGTRFIATKECNAHINYKKKLVDAQDTETCIIGRKLNMLRVLKNNFAQRILDAEIKGASKEELLKIIGSDVNRNVSGAIDGNVAEGTLQAGQSAGLVKDILSVEDLVDSMIYEYGKAVTGLPVF